MSTSSGNIEGCSVGERDVKSSHFILTCQVILQFPLAMVF